MLPRDWPERLVQVVNRRVPRASRSALTSDEAARVGGYLFADVGKLLVMPVLAGSVRPAGAFSKPERRFSRSR